jgi:hypothetical protein
MKGHTPAREAEELRRVAEIVLGRALEGRDSPTSLGRAERAKSSPAQAGQTAGKFSLTSGDVMKVTGRAIDIAQDAYRDAVAQMQRLTRREDADTGADALEAIKEKALAEEAARKAPEEELAAVAAAHQEEARQLAEEDKAMDGAGSEVAEAQPRAAAQEAAKRQRKRRARRLKGSQSRIRKPKQAERAEADLAQERARTQELEQQLVARGDQQKPLVPEGAPARELEQQLSIRQIDQKLLALAAPGNLEAARSVEQARLLLDQGNIIAARGVLERAAESGNALALFLLAETYDPASLSAWGIFSTWGIFGRRGDVTKAQELYAKAVARGVHEAKYRLSVLR